MPCWRAQVPGASLPSLSILLTRCCEGTCRVGERLRIELVQAPLCHLCQRFEKLPILLTNLHKGPCCIGEIVRIELVQAPLCHLCQRFEKLLILLTHLRNLPGGNNG